MLVRRTLLRWSEVSGGGAAGRQGAARGCHRPDVRQEVPQPSVLLSVPQRVQVHGCVYI